MSGWPWLNKLDPNKFHAYLSAHLSAEISLICSVFFSGVQACVGSVFWISSIQHFKILRCYLWDWLRWVAHTYPFVQSSPMSSPVSCSAIWFVRLGSCWNHSAESASKLFVQYMYICLPVRLQLLFCSFACMATRQQEQLVSSAVS